jgi:hypothetical protein
MQQVLLLTIEKLREGAVRDMDMIGSFILGASRMLAVNLKRRARRREALLEAFPAAHPSLTAAPAGMSVEMDAGVRVIRSRAIERLRTCMGATERAS